MTNDPLRVLLVTARADYGGGPQHVYLLISGADKSIEYFVACPIEEPYWSRFQALLGGSHMVAIPHRALNWSALLQVAKFIRTNGIQLIHAHGKGGAIYGRLLTILTRRPCIYTPHGLHVGDYSALGKSCYLLLERVLARFTARIISVSEGEAQQLRAVGLPASKILVIQNGVMIPLSARSSLNDGTRDVREIVVMTRYNHQKNTEAVIDIADAMRDRGRINGFLFRLLGTGAGQSSVQAEIERRDLSRHFILEGAVSSSYPYLEKAFLCLSTSRWEGMPYALLEAMANSVPVVASDVVGNSDVITPGQTGVLFPLDDNSRAADAILSLADDPEYWDRCSAAAYLVAQERYSARRVAQETLACYRTTLKG